jgi:hypothetical protein
MWIALGNDLRALQVAAEGCGLEFVVGQQSFHFSLITSRDFPARFLKLSAPEELPLCDHVLRLGELYQQDTPNPPHEIGVFEGERIHLVWDDTKDGFGLNSLIGERGQRLKVAYAIAVLKGFTEERSGTVAESRMEKDGTVHFTILFGENNMARINVRINPKGDTTFKVEGVEGEGCKDLTKTVEKALGKVTSDVETEEYYKGVDQHIQE